MTIAAVAAEFHNNSARNAMRLGANPVAATLLLSPVDLTISSEH
jgi:hypothetical protein